MSFSALKKKKKKYVCFLCTYIEFENCSSELSLFLLFLFKFHQDFVSSNYFQDAPGARRDMLVLPVGLLEE